MAGYDGFSMSNNARAARASGRYPASALAKIIGGGATAAGVGAVLPSREWHHTSSQYNMTDFYDIESAASDRADRDGITVDHAYDAIVAEIRAASKRIRDEATTETFRAHVEWIEWTGTRNHPKAIKHTATATVTKKGKCYTITPDDGSKPFRKFESTNGFRVTRI